MLLNHAGERRLAPGQHLDMLADALLRPDHQLLLAA
jgi:hypothetical protein